MTDHPSGLAGQLNRWLAPGRDNVMLIYGLYLIGFIPIFGSVPILVGLILAYLNRGQSDPIAESHYEYQIRQFWIGLLYVAVSAILVATLVLMVIGIIGIAATFVWWIVRVLKGLTVLSRGESPADPKAWLW